MAVKQVERRICDFCDSEASVDPCLVCLKDFCYDHGDNYRSGERLPERQVIALCDVCRKDFAARLPWAMKQAKSGERLSQREG